MNATKRWRLAHVSGRCTFVICFGRTLAEDQKHQPFSCWRWKFNFIIILEITAESDHCSISHLKLFDYLVRMEIYYLRQIMLLSTSRSTLSDREDDCGYFLGWSLVNLAMESTLDFVYNDSIIRAQSIVVDFELQIS